MQLTRRTGEGHFAVFGDGAQIRLASGVRTIIASMDADTRFGTRLREIHSPEELAAAVQSYCEQLSRFYLHLSRDLPPSLLDQVEPPAEKAG